MELSTHSLWQKIKKGNIKSFESLYKNYFPSMCLYAYGIISDEELVKEIVNDVFLKIWEKRADIDVKYGIKPYLVRCVHNACLDYIKLKKYHGRNQVIDISDLKLELAIEDEEYIFQKIFIKKLEKDVKSCIDRLPPKCREVFILSRFELLSYNEISEKLNISVNTVKTQISRALIFLKDNLKEHL
jgi:RNA polymerase sigma-70 factor (family 1)